MAQYKIISLRAQANGFKQMDIKSAGRFNSYEDACKAADRLNDKSERINTTYMAIKTFKPE